MKTTIIVASPSEKSFSKKIVEKLSKKLIENKAEYEIIDLYKDNFNPVMTEKEEMLYNEGKTDDELVKKYQQSIRDSDEMILVFPVWFNNVPAILKGFFDKVFIKNFAFSEEDNKTKGLLTNIKSGMVITTSESNTSYLKDKLDNPIETVIIKGTLEVCGMENMKYINLNVEDKEKEDLFESYFK
ncbi:NAD(P)H-dependent oxidoreductase [Romboutsia sp. 1001713B170131_170501_G6]|uniref:NAD(P)H-dependent oxidoreductase n=1 Tax=Romboutsia sp. 1001713B170131_170501_G6 TaxID=2787108 RepID=UPI0018AA38D6|nr:NAD(P)H-dependent oxidoreductase [Romboutsia sp. 1001713B170131_170501_G6]